MTRLMIKSVRTFWNSDVIVTLTCYTDGRTDIGNGRSDGQTTYYSHLHDTLVVNVEAAVDCHETCR